MTDSASKYLNIGCGRDIISEPGWLNIDSRPGDGVDLVHDMREPLPYEDDTIAGIYLSHVLEHIADPLPVLAELWRVAKPGAPLVVRVPHGASDDAWEDPTHVRAFFPGSFTAYGQPYFWRTADSYGYVGDWRVREVVLAVGPHVAAMVATGQDEEAAIALDMGRNVVTEMVATLEAVKPARKRLRALLEAPEVRLRLPAGFDVPGEDADGDGDVASEAAVVACEAGDGPVG